MGKERRKEALKFKLQRLQDNITRSKKDLDGNCAVMMNAYSACICNGQTQKKILFHCLCLRFGENGENIYWKPLFLKQEESGGDRAAAWWGHFKLRNAEMTWAFALLWYFSDFKSDVFNLKIRGLFYHLRPCWSWTSWMQPIVNCLPPWLN